MSKQIQDAYIVAATRTPVAKRNGMFKSVRPDDMLAHVLAAVVARVPGLDATEIGDVVVGCAMPEAEQGMNVARIGLLLAGLPNTVPGITINRFCASGLQAVADAAAPSDICELLPAVTEPRAANTGLSLPSLSAAASGRGPSSCSTRRSVMRTVPSTPGA